jgi:UDP-GlcNAc:undecaprenyl-phosphate GlcNAc-1-phosphate transferase
VELLVGLVVALAATPLAAALARRTGVVDHPGPLKTHRRPVAYLGGAAVFLGVLAGPIGAGRPSLLLPLGAALLLGTADDLRPLPARLRLGLELVIAVAAALVVPGDTAVRVAVGVLVVVLMNAVNLLDGQDGLAASVGALAALAFACLGGDATPVGLALAGALAGFLAYNRPPARIYLGDGGAYLLGTALAVLPSLADHASTSWSVWIAVPLLVAMPAADTGIAILRRLRAGRPLFTGDRSHVYDQLVDRGLSVTASTGACAAVQLVTGALGVLAARSGVALAAAVTAGALVLLVGAAIVGGFLASPDAAPRS